MMDKDDDTSEDEDEEEGVQDGEEVSLIPSYSKKVQIHHRGYTLCISRAPRGGDAHDYTYFRCVNMGKGTKTFCKATACVKGPLKVSWARVGKFNCECH